MLECEQTRIIMSFPNILLSSTTGSHHVTIPCVSCVVSSVSAVHRRIYITGASSRSVQATECQYNVVISKFVLLFITKHLQHV